MEEPGLQQCAHRRAVDDLAGLPGVERQGHGAGGEPPGEFRSGEGRQQVLGGDRAAAFGPGGVGGQQRAVHGQPVQDEGPARFRGVDHGLGLGESFPALGRGVERVAQDEGLLGVEEGVGTPGGGGAGAACGQEGGGLAYGVSDPRDEAGPVRAGRGGLPREQRGEGDGVQRSAPRRGARGAEAVVADGRPVQDRDEEFRAARGQRHAQGAAVRLPRQPRLADPAAQQGLRAGRVGGGPRIRLLQRVVAGRRGGRSGQPGVGRRFGPARQFGRGGALLGDGCHGGFVAGTYGHRFAP